MGKKRLAAAHEIKRTREVTPRADELSSDFLLGPKTDAWLRKANLDSREEIERLGPLLAYRFVKRIEARASLNLLWALVALCSRRDARSISAIEKADWKRRLRAQD